MADRQATGRGALRPFLFLATALVVAGCASPGNAEPAVTPAVTPAVVPAVETATAVSGARPRTAARSAGRLRPPQNLACDPNHLTSWFGTVSGYRRQADRTWLQISTDYDTVEALTLSHPGKPDASAQYLLWGEPFVAADWSRIESGTGKLHEGMRAIAWVCDDGVTPAVVDWQPVKSDRG